MVNHGNMYGPSFTFLGIPQCDLDVPASFAGADDEKAKTAMGIIESEIKETQAELTSDLLQLFTKLDEDIKTVLKKHGME